VLKSVGFQGSEIKGLPFDTKTATIPNDRGRVIGAPGVYTAGWIKRGPSGVIGTNRFCAQETVDSLLDDYRAGRLPSPRRKTIEALVADRCRDRVDREGWRRITEREKADGARQNRPQVKLTTRTDLMAVARSS
jgi:ferredoxin--NADP+ reductase